jgi:ketosteroid isomerase-like protein
MRSVARLRQVSVSALCRMLACSALVFGVFHGNIALGAQDDPDAIARSQVMALEKAWNQAYKMGDANALSGLLDNSLVLVEDDGSLKTKAEFLATIKGPTANEEQVAPESLTVRVFGKTAIAIGVISVKVKEHGKTVNRRERFIDTWIAKNGSWVCIATDATPMAR